MKRYPIRAKGPAGFLALVLCSTVAVTPAAAAGPAVSGPIATAAARRVAALPDASATQASQPAAAADAAAAPARPFFKTTKGAIAAALMAGTLGYAVYSFSNGRVKSPSK